MSIPLIGVGTVNGLAILKHSRLIRLTNKIRRRKTEFFVGFGYANRGTQVLMVSKRNSAISSPKLSSFRLSNQINVILFVCPILYVLIEKAAVKSEMAFHDMRV
jgi:hypothetical protein